MFVRIENTPYVINLEATPVFGIILSKDNYGPYVEVWTVGNIRPNRPIIVYATQLGIPDEQMLWVISKIESDEDMSERFNRAVQDWYIENAKKPGAITLKRALLEILRMAGIEI